MKATHGRKIAEWRHRESFDRPGRLRSDAAADGAGDGDRRPTAGSFYQTRLVQQVQTVDNEIVTAYQVREKRDARYVPATRWSSYTKRWSTWSTGRPARRIRPVSIMWRSQAKPARRNGDRRTRERTAAWFAGFVPAKQPQFAFAALYEGDVGAKVHGGSARRADDREDFQGSLQERGERQQTEAPTGRNTEPAAGRG